MCAEKVDRVWFEAHCTETGLTREAETVEEAAESLFRAVEAFYDKNLENVPNLPEFFLNTVTFTELRGIRVGDTDERRGDNS